MKKFLILTSIILSLTGCTSLDRLLSSTAEDGAFITTLYYLDSKHIENSIVAHDKFENKKVQIKARIESITENKRNKKIELCFEDLAYGNEATAFFKNDIRTRERLKKLKIDDYIIIEGKFSYKGASQYGGYSIVGDSILNAQIVGLVKKYLLF